MAGPEGPAGPQGPVGAQGLSGSGLISLQTTVLPRPVTNYVTWFEDSWIKVEAMCDTSFRLRFTSQTSSRLTLTYERVNNSYEGEQFYLMNGAATPLSSMASDSALIIFVDSVDPNNPKSVWFNGSVDISSVDCSVSAAMVRSYPT